MVSAATSPDRPWQCQDMTDGWTAALRDGDVRRCEGEEVRSSPDVVTAKERPEQGYGWKPCDEEKAEVRPVATHYRTVYKIKAAFDVAEARTRGFAAPALAGCAFIMDVLGQRDATVRYTRRQENLALV